MKRLFALGIVVLIASCAETDDSLHPPADASAPNVLEVRGNGETTDVLTRTVQASPDGVHVSVRNTTDETLSVSTETVGDGAEPGETSFVFPILPGGSRIRCLPMSEDNAMENGDWGSFDVLAPDGWVSPVLDCPGGTYNGVGDYAEGAKGIDDPLADAERVFRLDGDASEAGYSTSERRTFINVVDGSPKESRGYTSDGSGGWLQSESSGCSD